MGGLERPDAPGEPLFERQVVGQPSEQRLAEMDVRLNQTGENDEACAVENRPSVRRSDTLTVRPLSQRRDPLALDPHVCVEDPPPRIHCHDTGAGEHQRPWGVGGLAHAYVVTRGRALVVSWGRSK